MVAPRAYLPEGMPNYVTPSGLDALQNEMKELEDEKKSTTDRVTANWLAARIALVDERIRSARLQGVPEDCCKNCHDTCTKSRTAGKIDYGPSDKFRCRPEHGGDSSRGKTRSHQAADKGMR